MKIDQTTWAQMEAADAAIKIAANALNVAVMGAIDAGFKVDVLVGFMESADRPAVPVITTQIQIPL